MESIPTTDVKFREPTSCQLDLRVYRRSDKCYWTCQIRFNRTIPEAIAMANVWTSGLSIHPNLESVIIDAVRALPTTSFGFDDYTKPLQKFLDDKTSDNHCR